MLAGVCSGIGEYVGIDPNILRLAFAIATFFGGLGVGAYAVAWLLIPEEGAPTSIAQNILEKQKDSHLWNDVKLKFEGFQRNLSQPSRPEGRQAPYTRTGADGPEGPRE